MHSQNSRVFKGFQDAYEPCGKYGLEKVSLNRKSFPCIIILDHSFGLNVFKQHTIMLQKYTILN